MKILTLKNISRVAIVIAVIALLCFVAYSPAITACACTASDCTGSHNPDNSWIPILIIVLVIVAALGGIILYGVMASKKLNKKGKKKRRRR